MKFEYPYIMTLTASRFALASGSTGPVAALATAGERSFSQRVEPQAERAALGREGQEGVKGVRSS